MRAGSSSRVHQQILQPSRGSVPDYVGEINMGVDGERCALLPAILTESNSRLAVSAHTAKASR